MPKPVPIKGEDASLPAEDFGSHSREDIKRLIEGTRPDQLPQVMEAYGTASATLTETIKTLGDHATRLVADQNWGGESAKAMLTRIGRLQNYLRSLRDEVNRIPPQLSVVQDALNTARNKDSATGFEKSTEQEYYWVEASGMGAGQQMPANDPDADARAFMRKLNTEYHRAYSGLPGQLPWDEKLASPEPYMPPIERTPAPFQGNGLPYGDTSRSDTGLASTSPLTGPSTATTPSTTAPPAAGPVPPVPPVAGGPAPGSGTGLAGGPGNGRPGSLPGHLPDNARPGPYGATPPGPNGPPPPAAMRPGTTPPATNRATPPPTPRQPVGPQPTLAPDTLAAHRSIDPVTGPVGDPYTSTAQEPRPAGPTVRPGSVPVVDGSWPATRSPVTGGEARAAGMGGMPFMPMGGMAPQQESLGGSRPITSKSRDDEFFQPVIDCGPPVVG